MLILSVDVDGSQLFDPKLRQIRQVRESGRLRREWQNEGVVVTSAPTLVINDHYHKASLFLSGLDEIPAVRWSLTDQMMTAGTALMFFVCMFNGSIKTKHKVLSSITGKINTFYGKMGLGKKGFSSSVVCQITSGNDLKFLGRLFWKLL